VKCGFERIDVTTRAKSGASYPADTLARPSGNSPASSASDMLVRRSAVTPRSTMIFLAVDTSRCEQPTASTICR